MSVANAMKRLANELLLIQGKKALPGMTPHAVEGWTAAPSVSETGEENMLLWNVMIDGPPGTPYEGGTFRCTLTFPPEFPNHPPQLVFVTQIYHPNFPKVCPVISPLPMPLSTTYRRHRLHVHCVTLIRISSAWVPSGKP
jgi:ubiquitin-protein ligase